jgi:hypothetical protein
LTKLIFRSFRFEKLVNKFFHFFFDRILLWLFSFIFQPLLRQNDFIVGRIFKHWNKYASLRIQGSKQKLLTHTIAFWF